MHEPLSWLTLERYALGELSSEERARVAARLAASHEDQSCLDSILSDASTLPPLPVARPTAPEVATKLAALRRRRWLAGSSALLAAAAAWALSFVHFDALPASQRHVSEGVKGGDVALSIHGEQSGEDASTFSQGERFKVLLTCPEWLSTQLRVVVFQGRQAYEPLARVPVFSCGNHVPWPGAFRLDGTAPVDVCVSFGGSGEAERATSPGELAPSVVCKRLLPR
ncbi:MAG: hypothetical protein JWN04_4952 [Myxococcaceae bacterium]|nr:hypothetical protein [Myxococcaceae bacterium]